MKHAIIFFASLAFACGREARAPQSRSDQVARGESLYAEHCSECHGANGRGSDNAPALIGKEALPLHARPNAKMRKGEFRTAKDVYDFIRENMPPDNPASLSDSQYADILAFNLERNGVHLVATPLDARTMTSIVLHPEPAPIPAD